MANMANIDALLSEQARLKESLRIKEKSLKNISPKYKSNENYIKTLKTEVAQINSELAQIDSRLKSASSPAPVAKSKNQTSGTGSTAESDEPSEPELSGQAAIDALDESSRQAAESDLFEGQSIVRTPAPDPPPDWRVRISIAKGSNYFYNVAPEEQTILRPLKATEGVIFPYTPSINVAYSASYDQQTLPHSNYKSTTYGGSSVDSVSITADFTAQDVNEANYLLAVIHFFRSATKMFYGRDENPARGVPPPLLYLSGLGQYQFDNHPMVLQSFTYSLPTDVDYINAYPDETGTSFDGTPLTPFAKPSAPKANPIIGGINRLFGVGLNPGGTAKSNVLISPPKGNNNATRVPTKITITLSFLPVVTRRGVSNEFSLKNYASGELLRGHKTRTGGGFW
jgi:hypothetical protein